MAPIVATIPAARPWFDNHRRLRELIAELEQLSLEIAENDLALAIFYVVDPVRLIRSRAPAPRVVTRDFHGRA